MIDALVDKHILTTYLWNVTLAACGVKASSLVSEFIKMMFSK